MPIRKSRYLVAGQPVTLAFVACIADQHPEAIDTAPPPEPPRPCAVERPPRWSEKLIRRTLGKDAAHSARLFKRIGYESTARRIARDGV